MPKPEWGSKRICHACGARYYDLGRSPIICPKCSAEFDPEAFLRSRRGRTVVPEDVAPKKAVAKAKAEDDVESDDDLIDEEVDGDADVEEAAEVDLEDDVDKPAAKGKKIPASEDEDDIIADIAGDDDVTKAPHEDVSELGDDDIEDVIEVDPKDDPADS